MLLCLTKKIGAASSSRSSQVPFNCLPLPHRKSGPISRGSRDLHKYLGDPHRTHPPDPRNGFPSDDIADPVAVYSFPKFTILPDYKNSGRTARKGRARCLR